MSRRWKWDFEDDQGAARMSASLPLEVTHDADRAAHDAGGAADDDGAATQSAGGATLDAGAAALDPSGAAHDPSGAAHDPSGATQDARRARFRRRRGGAALLLVAALVAIVGLLSGSQRQSSRAGSPSRAGAPHVVARAGGPKQPEADQNTAVPAVLAYTPFVREGEGRGRDIALTFDDGPGPYSDGVLSVLEQFHVHGTFFAIGRMERYFSAATIRELRDGDVVGDHTETHPQMAHLSAHDQHEELFEQIARIELLEGPRPRLFRPPYGSFNAITIRELHTLGLLMVLWSVDAGDYLQPGVPTIVQRVLAGAHPGAIVLMHDGGGNRSQTIAALPIIIRALRAHGFNLVTVPQLLADDPPPHGQALPPNLSGD
jgi:peptidoglycan-N-acetylglucosamine deacetylase